MNESNVDVLTALESATGLKWERCHYPTVSKDVDGWQAYTDSGILRVCKVPRKDEVIEETAVDWRWTASRSEDHPEGRRSEHRETPYLYLTGSGIAETPEAAAGAALSYDFPRVEACGTVWYRDNETWIAPTAGDQIILQETYNRDGWTWEHPFPAAKALAEMIDGSYSHRPRLSGDAPTFEAAAVAALAAPDLFRAAALQFVVSSAPTSLLALLDSPKKLSVAEESPTPVTFKARPRL